MPFHRRSRPRKGLMPFGNALYELTVPTRPQAFHGVHGPREAGTVVTLTSQGMCTVRGSRALPVGTPVRDPEGRFRGQVMRVFGPVASPYLSVRPRRALGAAEALALVGTRLVVEEAERRGR